MKTRTRWILAAAMAAAGPLVMLAGGLVFATLSDRAGNGIATVGFAAGFPLCVAAVAFVLWTETAGTCLRVAAMALPLFVVFVVLHNLVYGLIGVEEGVFFLLALLVAPAMLVGGVVAAAHAARWHGPPAAHACAAGGPPLCYPHCIGDDRDK